MWRAAVQLTRGVALATPGAEGGVRHLALQPGAVVGDAGILVKLAALLQGKLINIKYIANPQVLFFLGLRMVKNINFFETEIFF